MAGVCLATSMHRIGTRPGQGSRRPGVPAVGCEAWGPRRSHGVSGAVRAVPGGRQGGEAAPAPGSSSVPVGSWRLVFLPVFLAGRYILAGKPWEKQLVKVMARQLSPSSSPSRPLPTRGL